MSNKVTYTKESTALLKKRYNEAVENNEKVFIFEGNEYLVDYAKHMIKYLEGVFKNEK
jgi:hypothetical protein|tara:strand:- start:2192 stop:2365 length:174 start_codon:yes stop_codon:yes gene_type:complete